MADETVTIDPTLLISPVAGTINSVTGYSGTDSMPGCTLGTCWYIINEVMKISQAELDFFVMEGQASNARKTDQTGLTAYITTLYNYGIFAPVNA